MSFKYEYVTKVEGEDEYSDVLSEYHSYFCTRDDTPGGKYKLHLINLLVDFEEDNNITRNMGAYKFYEG